MSFQRIAQCVMVMLAASAAAEAFINPTFTPAELARRSDLVASGTLATDGQGGWLLQAPKSVKGPALERLLLASAGASAQAQERFAEAVKQRPDALLFRLQAVRGKRSGYCFVGGTWFDVEPDEKGWRLLDHNDNMAGTYYGDVAMLQRMMSFLHANPKATVRTTVGTRWHRTVEVGRAQDIRSLTLIRLSHEGRSHPYVYVAADGGDRLLSISSSKQFADVTEARGLDPRRSSKRVAVIDVNSDGHDDLVTYDGRSLWLHVQNNSLFALQTKAIHESPDITGLHPLVIGGKAGLALESPKGPALLQQAAAEWTVTALAGDAELQAEAGPITVADFNGDGLPDILEAGRQEGRLWTGSAKGFGAAAACAVSGQGNAQMAIADFDADGLLDVYLDDGSNHGLWENRGQGKFEDVIGLAGWLGKKARPGAAVAMATDLNHDGWADLAIIATGQPFQYHFNRGFRTFAEEGELRLTGVPTDVAIVAAAACDFNGDGSEDLVIALADGRVYCLFNDLYDLPAVRVRLAPGVAASPVTVIVGPGKELPARAFRIDAAGPGTHIPASDATDGKLLLRWRTPEGQEHRQYVDVDPNNTIEAVIPAK